LATFVRRAELFWEGEVAKGRGHVVAESGAFDVSVTFPMTSGDPPGTTTPEELLAASHATCFGIGLRSVIARRGGRVERVVADAAVSAEKGPKGIRIESVHLTGTVEGLERIDDATLDDIAREVADECTISVVLRGSVPITHDVKAVRAV
jgi:osmotically inducible protein OsmC